MNRQQRRATTRKTHPSALPACYLLYCTQTDSYLSDADQEITTLRFTDEAFAAAIPTREEALELAKDVHTASGLRLVIRPRYLPFYH